MDTLPNFRLDVIIVGFILLYIVGGAIYRLYLSPIAKFPGPKIAAVTGWYESYHDLVRGGKYLWEIEKMHQKYGPIVRINPEELSIDDGEFYNELYVTASTRRTDGYENFGAGVEMGDSHFLTIPHDLHRRRRKPLEPYFSRLGVSRLEPMISERVRVMTSRIEGFKGASTILRMEQIFSALTGDVFSRLLNDEPSNLLEDPEFSPSWYNMWVQFNQSITLLMHFTFLVKWIKLVPDRFLGWLSPKHQSFMEFKDMARKQITEAQENKAKGISNSVSDTDKRASLFQHIVNSDMPPSEMHVERLTQEAQVLIGAGNITTARALEILTYYILANNQIRIRLQEELREPMAGYPKEIPSWTQLEKLPYLSAVIKEGLRLSYGASVHRLPRVSPDVDLRYKKWTIPRGVPVGMSCYFMHKDPNIYPDPSTFKPERWIGDINPQMNRNYVPFARGSRSCLGINIALAEIHLALACLFRPDGPHLQLFETDETDVIVAHDFFFPAVKKDSKGVRTRVL